MHAGRSGRSQPLLSGGGNITSTRAGQRSKVPLTGPAAQQGAETIGGALMAFDVFMMVVFGSIIVIQQFIIYLMYVRIRQLLDEIESIEVKVNITDTELENMISRGEEIKKSHF
jgi:hypothetical protein